MPMAAMKLNHRGTLTLSASHSRMTNTIEQGGVPMSVQVSASIDEATKQEFDKVCQAIGVSPSNAISMFVSSVIYTTTASRSAQQPSLQLPPKSPEKICLVACRGNSRWRTILTRPWRTSRSTWSEAAA